ncbi:subtilisin-like protein [Lactarius quietus]|nr:subtilisin-like protein [Lactarius quietus]
MHYLWRSVLIFLAASTIGGTAKATAFAPNWHNMHTKHKWNSIPGKWDSIGRPPVGTTIDLRIALKPQNENALIDTLYEVSDPRHPRYGMHLSKEQVAELVAPHPDTLKLVGSWLEHHGVSLSNISRSHGGSWLTVTGVPVSKANDLLGASYHLYQYAGTNETILRTIGYALPSVLHAHVKTVAPTTYFGSPHTLQQKPRVHRGPAAAVLSSRDDDDDDFVTPKFLRWLYKSEEYVPVSQDKNVLGVVGFHGQYISYDDLTEFMGRFRSDAKGVTFTVEEVNNGDFNPYEPHGEPSSDMQYAQGIAWPTPHVFYSVGGLPPGFVPDSFTPENNNEPYLDWLKYMIDLDEVPQTITTSYGGNEQTFPFDYADSVCDLFAQLGSRGVSLLFASGNEGVGGGDCKKNDGSNTVEFQPQFPSTCPYVTSVGGTKSIGPEVAAEFSSGGFSNFFKRPPYQDKAMKDFFDELGSQYADLYNATSRGFPDVAAQAMDFVPILNGKVEYYSEGTSLSTPVVAGLISLLNDYRISEGKEPLGFLNPWLYEIGLPGLNDIKDGENPGCGTEGFSAVPGWDPVTGLGTPNFQDLLKIISKFELGQSSGPSGPNP